jgi:hypothetical protein
MAARVPVKVPDWVVKTETVVPSSCCSGVGEDNRIITVLHKLKDSVSLTMRILKTTWISFIFGAVAGAVVVSSFHSIGLWGIMLPLVLLIVAEIRKQLPLDLALQ